MRRLRDPRPAANGTARRISPRSRPTHWERMKSPKNCPQRHGFMADELGDLQLHVVFHSQWRPRPAISPLRMCWTVATSSRPHPHISARSVQPRLGSAQGRRAQHSRRQKRAAGVAIALPALERAMKLQRRAARTGSMADTTARAPRFSRNWRSLSGHERSERTDELGDLLFAVVNLARKLTSNRKLLYAKQSQVRAPLPRIGVSPVSTAISTPRSAVAAHQARSQRLKRPIIGR